MKAIRYQMMSLALALLAVGCNDDEIAPDRHPANTGDEVQFGVTLPGGSTRTIYGEETGSGFPVYWVNGDKVKVASPQCNIQQAEYLVTVKTETQNYADNITKTGDAGLQWGASETADFYSIYPSEGATFSFAGNTVTADLSVNATQYASITDKGESYYAQPADMNNVVMYAKNAGVEKTSETVPLQYTPFSTVIEFEVNAPATATAGQNDGIIIQTLTLTAPTGTTIAGNFTFSFPETEGAAPSVSPAAGGRNAITLHLLENNQYKTTLSTAKQTLKAKMCLMPISSVQNLEGWTVALNTSVGTFSKMLTAKTGELKPGLVHKVKLPELDYANGEWVYNLNNWITSLPDYKNIYLSELSLPGAWYVTDKDYQGNNQTIANLWSSGIRAFGLECRSSSENQGNIFSPNWVPTHVVGSNSGTNSDLLGTTGGDSYYYNGTPVSTYIKDIATELNKHQDEYAVLVLCYADGGRSGLRKKDYAYFINGLAKEIQDAGVSVIYENEITPNTTVNDVLGKLIIKVNVDSNIPKDAYNNNMNALFSYNPYQNQMSDTDKFIKPFFSKMYWKTWEDSYKSLSDFTTLADNELRWCFNNANRTKPDNASGSGRGDTPTYTQRKTALVSMMNISKQVYEASTHNVWFYFHAGGTGEGQYTTTSPSPADFATNMNSWLLDQINAKADASPLGIVLYNFCTNSTYKGPEITKAIIDMNSKFYLKHAGSEEGGTSGQSDVISSAPGYSTGVTDKGENAINGK